MLHLLIKKFIIRIFEKNMIIIYHKTNGGFGYGNNK